MDGYTGEPAVASATASDPEGDALTATWTVKLRPAGSVAALASPDGLATTFVPDVDGLYALEVAVSDGRSTTRALLALEAHHPIAPLAGHVIDAEYSRALDALVYVSAEPHRLHVVRTAGGDDLEVVLPLGPTSVSIGPDGRTAAVGHDGWISIVGLTDGVVKSTLAVSCEVLDVVLAGNGYVYAFPLRDQWSNIHSVAIATGVETESSFPGIYAGTVARLHPSGTKMYGADNGLSPSDIEHYDIRDGTAQVLRDSPYHGDYPMCGDLWISDDGRRIFTACGKVFRATDSADTDMTYAGALGRMNVVAFVDHAGVTGAIVAVPAAQSPEPADDVSFRVYDDDFLAYVRSVPETRFRAGGAWFKASSRFAFLSSDGRTAHVVTQAAAGAGLAADCALASYAL